MNKEYWNNLFEKREKPIPPENFLKENYSLLWGRVLDLACGDGRNTLFLAEVGFDVVALDFSEAAIKKIETFNRSEISTVLTDLNSGDDFKGVEGYDSVVINHYIPEDEILLIIQKRLKNRGRLMLVAFSDISEIEERYSFSFGYMENLLSDMKVIKKETFSNEWGKFNGMILEKGV